MVTPRRVEWPEGKRFAFTAFDDADYDRLSNVRPVYDFLRQLGFRTTKSVWTQAAPADAPLGGLSTEDSEYLAWAQSLQSAGFEIGFHGARSVSSERAMTAKALAWFHEQFGEDPRTMSNHFQNAESIYWGAARLSGWRRLVYRVANARHPLRAEGHIEGSPHFWGDLCRARIRYVRNFVFREINTLAACPQMPYHDPERSFVNAWFASTEGGDVDSWCATLEEANQDRLVAEGGACIMYVHFAKGFCHEGKLHPRFVAQMERLAALGGWFVPACTLLDFLAEKSGGIHELTAAERAALEGRWLRTKLRHGSS
jgi:hypothetical protein